MIKIISLLIISFLYSFSVVAQPLNSSEQWECALDLHQGDTGTLSLAYNNGNLQGEIQIKRNTTVFNNQVTGTWYENQIELTRLLNDDSSDEMTGVSVYLGTKKVNMGGRYGLKFQGVWSANCDLISKSNSGTSSEDSSPLPSISTRVSPNSPSNKNSITFSAVASHPEGIKKITFFVGNNEIHSCEAAQCEYKSGALNTGVYNWRVEAVSTNGKTSEQAKNRLVVRNSSAIKSCRVSGRAIGSSAPLAEIYLVKLYGPNNNQILKASSRFNNGFYEFDNLAKGEYQLVVDTQGDDKVLVTPATSTLTCKSQSNINQDIDFR